jgi:AraC-like DNA-binding protein
VRLQFIRRIGSEGKTLTALREAEEAYAEAKALNETMPMAHMLSAIAEIYTDIGQYDEAIRYYTAAIEMAALKPNPGTFFFFNHYDYLASLSSCLNRPDEQLRYIDSMKVARDIMEKYGSEWNFARDYFAEHCHRASAYAMMKQPEEALRQIRLAETFYDERWNEQNEWHGARLDEVYAQYFAAAGEYDRAMERISRVLKFYDNWQYSADAQVAKKSRAQILFSKGDYKQAAEAYSDIMHYNDSVNRAKFYAQINELRTIYQLDKAELEAERRQAVIRQQRITITALTVIGALLLLLGCLTLWNRNRIARKNRGLFRQIREQDALTKELEQMTARCMELEAATPAPPAGDETPHDDAAQQSQISDRHHWQIVAKLHDYLLRDRHFTTPDIATDSLVVALATNRTYLFEAVTAVAGKTPQEYINSIRLAEAKLLLETTGDICENIAETCGFKSARTFYRLFREQYNLTPTEYRKMAK